MADSDNESGGERDKTQNAGANSAGELSPREQDRLLPIANVSRIMKKALPANSKISKDAKETVQECVSEFISFVTGEASDKCQREKRKTINGDDILWAMATLGFEDYVDPLKVYLQGFREIDGEKVSRDKDAPPGSGAGGGGIGEQGMVMMGHGSHRFHQGQVYTSGGFHHMALGGSGGGSGIGKGGQI